MDSGAWRVGADLFKHGYNVSIDVSFWQDQKERERGIEEKIIIATCH